MIELKVECDCGQNYKFEVEPIQGRMPFRVNCPACGEDGTQKANALLQQMAPAPVAAPVLASPAPVAPRPAPAAMRIAAAPASAVAPPPITAAPTARPGVVAAKISQLQKGNDGWSKSETGLSKIGTYVVLTPSILGAMLASGFFGLDVSPMILAVIVGICGVVGGAINILGRGPILIGMLVGLTMALGGFGAVFWWTSDKTSVRKYELAIAFLVGAAPGFALQCAFQKIVLKRKQSAEA